MNAKANFLTRRELTKWWVAVAHDDRFAEVCTHARAMLMEQQPTQDETRGAENFLKILEGMTDGPEGGMPFPNPGMIHNVDSQANRPKTQPQPKKRKES